MQSTINGRTVFLVSLALLCASCGARACDPWQGAPRTEYYIEGGAIEYKQAAGAPQPVVDYIRGMMEGRNLYMDLWRVDADSSDERYKIQSDYVSSRPGFMVYNGQSLELDPFGFSGRLIRDDGTLQFDIVNIFPGDERFTDLRAWGSCDYSDAQRLIKQVRLPEWSVNTSTDSVEISWEVAGRFEDGPFSVSFTQVYLGRSRYPVYSRY